MIKIKASNSEHFAASFAYRESSIQLQPIYSFKLLYENSSLRFKVEKLIISKLRFRVSVPRICFMKRSFRSINQSPNRKTMDTSKYVCDSNNVFFCISPIH